MIAARTILAALILAAASCSQAVVPASLDTVNDACATCRMVVSDPRTASQIVAPLEEPRFFDDLGCLAGYLSTRTLPAGAVVFVADHRTGAWVRTEDAVFTRLPSDAGAMGSRLVAHASAESRRLDPDAAQGILVPSAVALAAVADAGTRR